MTAPTEETQLLLLKQLKKLNKKIADVWQQDNADENI